MEANCTQSGEVNSPTGSKSRPLSSIRSASAPSFFNVPLQTQTPCPSPITSLDTQPPQMEVSFDPASYLLLAAILDELRTKNAIEITKLQREDEQKQEESEAAKQAESVDKERFKNYGSNMFA